MTDSPLTPDREQEIRTLDLLELMSDRVAPLISGHLAALLAEVDRLRAELGENEGVMRALRRLRDTAEKETGQLRTRVAQLEALKPAPIQTCRACGAGYNYGQPCSVCEFKRRVAAEMDTPPRELTPEQARWIEQRRPETNTAHACNLPLTRRLDCGHCPHEVCQDCDRCPHTCRCAEADEAAFYLLVNGGGTPQTDTDMDGAARIASTEDTR